MGKSSQSTLPEFGRFLVQRQVDSGERLRVFGFSGYRGMAAGEVSWGVRRDGCLLRLSSDAAKEHWAQVYGLATNVSRLDVQVTVQPVTGPTKRLLSHHKELRRKRRAVGRPPKFKFWYGPDGPEAMTLGSRTSDWFGRVYDKFIESGLPEWLGCLRYEVELKRFAASDIASKLDHTEEPHILIEALVSSFVAARGCRLPLHVIDSPAPPAPGDSQDFYKQSLRRRNHSSKFLESSPLIAVGTGKTRKRLIWLTNAVKPTVQALMDQGQQDLMLEALGLCVKEQTVRSTVHERWTDFDKWR